MVSKFTQLSFVGQPAAADPSPEYDFLLFPRPLGEPPPEVKAAPPPPEGSFPLPPPVTGGEAVLLGVDPLAVDTGGEAPSVETEGEAPSVEAAGGGLLGAEAVGAVMLGCAPFPVSTTAFTFPAGLSMPPGEVVPVGLELGLLAAVLLATEAGG